MASSSAPPKKDDQMVTLIRAPRELVEAFDKAIELGFIQGRSRNAAVVKLMEKSLREVFFVIEAFEKAKEIAKSPKYQDSDIPREILEIQLAMEVISQTPSSKDIMEKYKSLIGTALANSTNPQLKELKSKLSSIFKKGDENDENKL